MKWQYTYFLITFALVGSLNGFSQNLRKTEESFKAPKVRFAILADRTGGESRGVFKEIVSQMNTLCPDFVVSVGDVIDGYTTNELHLTNLWNEFDSLATDIKVPFYVAPGNHDISNGWMEEEWKKRFGQTYRSLSVNDDLFFFLNTEDGKASCISQQQVDYFRHALEEYKKDGWIYLFMHRPLWKYENKDGYEKIEELLGNRQRVLVFSGHEHHYVMNNIDGRRYYMLSTSGGGNNLRNISLGEFHHFFFVTMDKENPTVSSIQLNGIVSDKIVNEKNEKTVSVMRNESWFSIKPTLLQKTNQEKVLTNLQIVNDATIPIRITGKLPSNSQIQFTEEEIDTIVPARTKVSIELTLVNIGRVNLLEQPIRIALEARAKIEDHAPEIVTHLSKIWELDVVRLISKEIKADWINVRPGYIKEDWDWKGDTDGKFSFSFSANEQNLILEIKATDDQLILYPKEPQRIQDKFFVNMTSSVSEEVKKRLNLICMDGDSFFDENYQLIKGIKGTVNHTDVNLNVKIIIPKKMLGNRFDKVRLNIGFMDHDNDLNTKPSVLWWNSLWHSSEENNHSGIFSINN